MTRRWHRIIAVWVIIGIALMSCSASAVTMPVADFRISLEKNGTPLATFADFSLVCYGHSYLNVAGDSHFVNRTPGNPVPLNEVLDLHVFCNPTEGCRAENHDTGDPERSEWCELAGNGAGGDPFAATIIQENLDVNCTGREYTTEYRRCNAEARVKNQCDDLLGSKKLHCMDSQRDDEASCQAGINQSGTESIHSAKWCDIRFNLTSSGMNGPDKAGSSQSATRPVVLPTQSRNGIESLYCSIVQFFGRRCE